MNLLQVVLDETESTQIELKLQLAQNENLSEFSFVQAYAQKTGRGRQGRVWESPVGILYLSVLLTDHFSTWTPHLVAVALFDSLVDVGIDPTLLRIKWPNDILVEGNQKLAGIICEKIGNKIVAGIGVNVLTLPLSAGRPVSSIQEVLHPAQDEQLSEDTIVQLRDFFMEHLARPRQVAELKYQYQNRMLFQVGQKISWQDEQTQIRHEGEYVKLGEHGELVVNEFQDSIGGAKELIEKRLFSEEVHLLITAV